MRSILIILIFLSLTKFSNGQTAIFFADGSRWVYHNQETWETGQQFLHSSDEQNIIQGDTVIGGINYFKLYTTFHNTKVVYMPNPIPAQTYYSFNSVGPTFIRYDTTLKRVYYLPGVDSSERLIYDFNLQIGDTIPMQATAFPITVIHSIDTISFFGVSAKRFFLDLGQGSANPDNFIVEGLGGSNGLTHFQPSFISLSGGFYMTALNCFQFIDSIYSPTNSSCPFIDHVSSVEPLDAKYSIVISPNPTQDFFAFTISPDLLNAQLIIANGIGRITQFITLTEQTTTIRLPASGIYFWRLEQQGKLIKTGKLIME